jgi:hypothetical protein
MNKIKCSIQFSLCLLVSAAAFCQTEKFDIVSYTAPKDFTRDNKKGVLNYTHVDTTTGKFCVISLFASTTSSGNAEKDFKKDWKELVQTPFKAIANPETETQSTDGWKTVTGASLVKMDGAEVYIILTVFSGFGKKFCVRTSLNDPAYTSRLDALFETMELDKTKKLTVNNNVTPTVQASEVGGKFGAMIYTTPAGWSEKTYTNGVEIKPVDLPADETLSMQILQPLNFSGTLQQALTKSYDEVAAMQNGTKMYYAGGAEFQKTELQKSFNGWEYISGSGSIKVENGTPYKSEYGLEVFVIKINNRFERVAILKSSRNCNYLSKYFSADRQAYRNAIDNFLFSIQFTDGQEPILKRGTAVGSGIVGVWQGISLQTSATSGIRYNVYLPIFLTNGQAYFGPKFPGEGLDALDTRVLSELHRRDWGTYTFSNGRGILKMPYADIPLRMEGDKLIITANKTDHKFFQMPSVDGARFNGTYVMSKAYEKIPVISFTADGRFIDKGAIKVLCHEYSDCLNPGLLPGSGTYEVKNYSILFNYTDGRKIKIAFLGTGYKINNQSPATLAMSSNDDDLRRQ